MAQDNDSAWGSEFRLRHFKAMLFGVLLTVLPSVTVLPSATASAVGSLFSLESVNFLNALPV